MTGSHTNGTAASASSVPAHRLKFTHDHWMASLGLPLYTGFYIEDLRELELGRWQERGCDSAFVQLMVSTDRSKGGKALPRRA